MTIRILPEAVANQIAAGEVVERPASVVKELVENAVDAGATRIVVEVEGAGKKRIRVTDNGCGMGPDDARLAFERHATSKVHQAGDLVAIRSLGFRGEALPSIASVARVRLVTAEGSGAPGTEVRIEGGAAPQVRAVSHPGGTLLEVADLFYNTPARRKFLKSDATEASHITQVITQQALARPDIHFILKQQERTVIDTPGTDQRLYRIAELFGSSMTRELIQVEREAEGMRISGFVSSPVFTRSNRNAQYSFINLRGVRDKVILHATQQGYSHLLPRGQHPVLFLYLSMPPEAVDFNVHPAKAEVRFAHQQEVYRFVLHAVQEALRDNVKGEGLSSPAAPGESPRAASWFSLEAPRPRQTRFQEAPVSAPAVENPAPDRSFPSSEGLSLARAWGEFIKEKPSGAYPESEGRPSAVSLFEPTPRPVSDMIFSDFQPIGQLNQSFIVMQGPAGLLVVDQHIAHERVLYERFRKAALNRTVEIQNLLFPLAVEFAPAEAAVLKDHLEGLKELGLDLEPFGTNGFLLRAVPAILKKQDHEAALREIAQALGREGSGEEALQSRYAEIQILMACRNAITINHPLELDQIRKLMFDLEQTEMPYTCPHGRPIALLFDIQDILRQFHRK